MTLLQEQAKYNQQPSERPIRAIDYMNRRLDAHHPKYRGLLEWCQAAYFGDIFPHLKVRKATSILVTNLKQQSYIKCFPPQLDWSDYQLWHFVSTVYSLELDYRLKQWHRGNRTPLPLEHLIFRETKDFLPGNWHLFYQFWLPFIRFMP